MPARLAGVIQQVLLAIDQRLAGNEYLLVVFAEALCNFGFEEIRDCAPDYFFFNRDAQELAMGIIVYKKAAALIFDVNEIRQVIDELAQEVSFGGQLVLVLFELGNIAGNAEVS